MMITGTYEDSKENDNSDKQGINSSMTYEERRKGRALKCLTFNLFW